MYPTREVSSKFPIVYLRRPLLSILLSLFFEKGNFLSPIRSDGFESADLYSKSTPTVTVKRNQEDVFVNTAHSAS